ncbi:MAG: hypothetical protein IPM24_07770, partial [Bryobacterales bacterium]|nr:hypothetical protein [Bryobacterales bacterium]
MDTAKHIFILAVLAGCPASLAAQTYDYDDAGRLVRAAYPQGGGVLYRYDDSDNMIEATGVNLPPAPAGVQLSRESTTTFRLNWQAVEGASSYVVLRAAAGTNQWREVGRVTAPALTFLDTTGVAGQAYSYRLTAVTAAGQSAFSVEVTTEPGDTTDPGNGRRITLGEGGASALVTAGTAAETVSGYAKVTVESGAAPYGLAVFQLRQNGATVGETGVPATPPTRGARIFIEYRNGVRAAAGQYSGTVDVNTGIAFVNPGEEPASFSLTLRNNAGSTVARGSGVMQPGRHTARLVSDFNQIAPDFALPADFPVSSGFGTLDIESDQPLSVLALRLTVNQRGELLFSSTQVLDLRAPAPAGPVYFAHVPEGGGFTSKLALMSTSPSPQSGSVRLLEGSGGPFQVRTTGPDGVGIP